MYIYIYIIKFENKLHFGVFSYFRPLGVFHLPSALLPCFPPLQNVFSVLVHSGVLCASPGLLHGSLSSICFLASGSFAAFSGDVQIRPVALGPWVDVYLRSCVLETNTCKNRMDRGQAWASRETHMDMDRAPWGHGKDVVACGQGAP